MRVAVFCEDISALGGVRTFISDFVSMMKPLGVAVSIVSRYARDRTRLGVPGAGGIEVLLSDEYLQIVDSLSQPSDHSRNDLRRKLADHQESQSAKIRRVFRGLGEEDGVLVVQIPTLLALSDAGVLAQTQGRPSIIAQFHGTYSYAVEQPYFGRLVQACNSVDKTVFLTDEDRASFEDAGIRNGAVIPNSVSLPGQTVPMAERPRMAVFIGRLHPEKNLAALIDGWALASKSLEGWVLGVYGDGPEEEDVRTRIAARGLTDSVRLMGRTREPSAVLRRARVNLMTSPREGMPMTILEALAEGTPSVCMDAGPGTRELVDDPHCGRVVPQGDLQAWADALVRLAGSEASLQEASIACGLHAMRFSKTIVGQEWKELLDSLARQQREENEDIVRFKPIDVDEDVSGVRVAVDVADLVLPEKAYLLTAVLTDPEGRDTSRQYLDLQYSAITGTCFQNSPPSKPIGDRNYVEFSLSLRPSNGSLRLSLLPWGTRLWSPGRTVSGVAVTLELNCGGGLSTTSTLTCED